MEIFIHFTNENFYELSLILICFNHMYLVQYSPDWSVSSNMSKKQIFIKRDSYTCDKIKLPDLTAQLENLTQPAGKLRSRIC